MNDDGSLKVLNNDYIESEQKWGGGIGRATFVDPSKDDGYLQVKFVKFQPNADYKIIATDYTSYTVIYTCLAIPFGIYGQEYVWLLTRDSQFNEDIELLARQIIAEKVPLYDTDANWNRTP